MTKNLTEALELICSSEVYRFILSNPIDKDSEYRRIAANRQGESYLLEQYTRTQVFHKTILAVELSEYLASAVGRVFRQFNGWDGQREYSIRISAKGKVLFGSSASADTAPKALVEHNRAKNYLLPEGKIIPPLVDMGIFTQEGRVVRSMYDKYRQINRFIEIVDDEVAKLDPLKPLSVIDFGCGKSYLTFVLYYYLTEIKGFKVRMIGLDLKREVIEKCGKTAVKYGYDGLSFELGDINGYKPDGRIDIVITLHACDTATDYALYNATSWGASMIFSAPCCQHELNGQIESKNLAILTRYGIVKERVSALMTDAIRANMLEYCGYRTQLLEFIDLEHTPKNIMIRAIRKNGARQANIKALDEVEALIAEFKLNPTIYRLIMEAKGNPKTIG